MKSMEQYDENKIQELIKDNSIKFFEVLKYTNKKPYEEIIQKLCKKNQTDYFDLATKALKANISSWNIGNILVSFIPYSVINIDNILEFYRLFFSKENGTSTHFKLTQDLVKNDKDLGEKLLDILLKKKESFAIPHISAILVELHNSHNNHQYNRIMRFLKGNDLFELKCAIGYIHRYSFSNEELKNIFELFKEKIKLSNNEIDRELIYNSYDLIEGGYEYFSEIILLYMDKEDIDIKSHFAQVLNYASRNHIGKDWFKKSFLAIIDIEQQNILYNIEYILNIYLEKDDYDFIKKFLYKWVEKGNLSSIYSKTTFSLFAPKFNKSKYFSRFITEALVYENSDLHQILPKLILEKELKLDVETMKDISIEDYLYICRKILGYFYEFEIINSMIFSILSVEKLPKEVRQIVIDILINFIGQEYQHNTLEYLKILEDDTLNENEKEVKKIVILELTKRKEKRNSLPKIKELLPSSQQNRIISRVQGVAMQKAMAESEKDSFWSQIATKTPICCGRGWFSEVNDKFTDVAYLQSHSHSITMPSSSQSQPIHYEFDRFNFRIAKKGL
jgi:hypothetical protein